METKIPKRIKILIKKPTVPVNRGSQNGIVTMRNTIATNSNKLKFPVSIKDSN